MTTTNQQTDLEKLEQQFGGYWGGHPTFTVAEWQYLVSEGDTRQGYWEWVMEALSENSQ